MRGSGIRERVPHPLGGRLPTAVLGVILLAFGLLAAPTADAQEDPDELAISAARVEDHPEVSLTVSAPLTVIDTDVPAGAFRLTEDGEERDIEVQRLDSDVLEVALVMDTSGSMEGAPIEAAIEAAQEFVAAMPAGVGIGVVEFNTEVTLLSDFTTDRGETAAALDGLAAGGWTALYDAITAALDRFDERGSDRRAIVMLTDGGDNRSEATLEETVERLAGGDEFLHIVELITTDRPVPRERFGRDDPEADAVDLEALEDLAVAAAQGSVVSPEDLDAISGVYEEIASTLLNQYEITFTSEAHGAVEVNVSFEHERVVAAGTRRIDLPPDPDAEADDIGEPDEPEETDRDAAPAPPDEPFEPGLLAEPWVFRASLTAFLVGLALALLVVSWPHIREKLEGDPTGQRRR